MKIYKLVNVLGALNDTGKLASDMYELGKKRYYSKAHQQEIPISEMDFQHMVRAFVKQNDEDVRTDTQEGKVRELEKANSLLKQAFKRVKKDLNVYKNKLANNDTQEYHNLHGKIDKLDAIIEEKDDIIKKLSEENEHYKKAYHEAMQFGGARYVFAEIPNNEYGKKLTRGMKVYLNHDSYTMRVRGQHIKPELKGTGATHYGQSIEQSTHLRVYIDKK
jgi:predicted RNase H-like nuclease (RuvC/YqgF family)